MNPFIRLFICENDGARTLLTGYREREQQHSGSIICASHNGAVYSVIIGVENPC